MVLSAMKPAAGRSRPARLATNLRRTLQRQFRLAARVAPGRGLRRPTWSSAQNSSGSRRRAADSCRITIWAVRRGPSLPARNTLSSSSTLSSSASKVQTSRFGSTSMTPRRVGQPARLDRGMQMKSQRIIGLVALDPAARRRRQRVLAVEPRAVLRDHQHPAVHDAEPREIAVMRGRQQHAVGDRLAIAFDIDRAADDGEPCSSRFIADSSTNWQDEVS